MNKIIIIISLSLILILGSNAKADLINADLISLAYGYGTFSSECRQKVPMSIRQNRTSDVARSCKEAEDFKSTLQAIGHWCSVNEKVGYPC